MGDHCLFCSLHWYTHTVTVLHILIHLFNFINHFIERNLNWFCIYNNKEGKISLYSWSKLASGIIFSFIIQKAWSHYLIQTVYLSKTILAIYFQTSNLKQTQCYYCNCRHSNRKWEQEIIVLYCSLHWYTHTNSVYKYLINILYFVNNTFEHDL